MTTGIVADVLLDTDVFINHLRGAVELRPGRHRVHYSVITRAELVQDQARAEFTVVMLDALQRVAAAPRHKSPKILA